MSIPCSTRELSSCLCTFVLDVAHFRLRPAPRIVCVVIHLREPERGFRNPYLRDLATSLETPVVVSRCHRFVRSVHLSPRIVFTTSTGFPALPAMEWIPMHGCDPAYQFRVPLGHPAIAPRCRVNGRGVQNGETARASRVPRPDLVFRSVRSHRFMKSPIRDTCDQRLPPTLPILAPTLRTVIECVQVSLALSMHHAFSRRATRFRGSTRFTQRRFLPKVKRCFPPARPRMVESFHRAHF